LESGCSQEVINFGHFIVLLWYFILVILRIVISERDLSARAIRSRLHFLKIQDIFFTLAHDLNCVRKFVKCLLKSIIFKPLTSKDIFQTKSQNS
jgi:hypothetical protein